MNHFSRRDLLAALAAAGLGAATPERPVFRDIASETGLRFVHTNGAAGKHYMPEIMGPGVALFDYDNDGDLDVYLIQGTALAPGGKPGTGNRLFKNLLSETGKLQFVDVTERAGVGHIGYGMGVAVGDYDNDGFLDLYVTNFGRNILYHNNGNGTFTDVTAQAGVEDSHWSTSAAWVDIDGDGWLDLFVCNYVDFTVAGNRACVSPSGEPDYCTPKAYRAVPSRLFRNLGNGRFEDISDAAGINRAYGPALGVVCRDLDEDGRLDIYVANDTAANLLWMNQGNVRFKEAGLDRGVAYAEDGRPKAGMGVAIGDVENNGGQALLVTNLTREGVTLFRGDGKGQFEDATAQFGLLQPTFGYTGFGAQLFDYDNDGFLDLFIANGAVTLPDSGQRTSSPYAERNQLFHNESGGKFRDVSAQAGAAFQIPGVSRGAALGDIDNDGAIDIVVANNNGPVQLLRNEIGKHAHWLALKLECPRLNRFAIGAKAALIGNGKQSPWRDVRADSSYLSANDLRVHFGLGAQSKVDAVLVRWPDGTLERFAGGNADRILTLRRGSGQRS
jgi:hypothetical protein